MIEQCVSVCVCVGESYLEGLDEGPQQDANGFSLSQQLDETSRPEQPQEAQVDEVVLERRRRTKSVFNQTQCDCTASLYQTEKTKKQQRRKERIKRERKKDNERERERGGGSQN